MPCTHDFTADGLRAFTNRLIGETSPYLLQHAHNPVDWYPWGDEAFERARREQRPVFLSIGYSTCHWCHVMERESFEDEEIARYLNENYVAVKVDREERPDVDSLYMNAVVMFTGGGGWPMTVVLTPERQPFFAGTYFPARDGERGVRTGLLTMLRKLRDLYATEPDRAVALAREVTQGLQAAAQPGHAGDLPGFEAIRSAMYRLAKGFDATNGGFSGAPKFPMPATLELAMRYCRRMHDPQARDMVVRTLEKMAAGGICDHVGGGFHRYSTDARWLVPHFEKMLYDNAQLVVVYLEAFQLTGRDDFAKVARATLDYLLAEMSDPAGGFYSATDADSPVPGREQDEEGWFFTWTLQELDRILGPVRAQMVSAYYGVSEHGHFEGRNILHAPAPLDAVAAVLKIAPQTLHAELESARRDLYAARQQRPAPARDEKVIAAWNGLMISALCRGAQVLGPSCYAQRATRAAEFVLDQMRAGETLRRTWKAGSSRHEGTLSDYAFVAQGLLDLYETTHDVRWLSEAIAFQRQLDLHFWDEMNGGYYLMPHQHEALLARDKPDSDGAEPSGNSVAALNLLRLCEFTSDTQYRIRAERLFRSLAVPLNRGVGAAKLLCALDYALDKPLVVVLVGSSPGATAAFEALFHRAFVPNRALIVATAGDDLLRQANLVPLLREKRVQDGNATAFVCRQGACELPTSDLQIFAKQIA